jgi:2-polyprenyl-3-methyl-5-hydroxy-6-metoxy-1,4-benzoquinol methylase
MSSPTDIFDTHSKCVACGSEALLALEGYERHYLRKCKSCKLAFVGRVPREEELQAFYSQYSYARTQWLSPITRKRYQELLVEFEPFRKTGRILDSGCGAGFFLEEAKAAGWEVWGTEYSDEAIKLCTEKGISMHHGSLQNAPFEPGFFDVVTSFEVIEHLHHVKDEAQSFHKLLRTGGLLYCTTPNFNAISRYFLKDRYNVIGYPEHLTYFTPRSIHALFSSNGFRKKSLTTTGISITRIKKSLGKSQQAFISPQSDDEQLRKKMEEKWHWKVAKLLANGVLGLTGKGVTLKAYYIKK